MTTAATTNPNRYRRWDGELNRGNRAWLVIVVTGIRLALKERKTRTLVMTVSGVALGNCIILYVLSLLELVTGTEQGRAILEFVRAFLRVDISGVTRIEEYREILWRVLFLLVIKVELFWVLLTVSKVGPGLIAHDLRHRALPIYFAKPVTPLTYVLGKWIVVAAFVAMVVLVPNLFSMIVGVLITGGLHTWGQTLGLGWDLLVSGLLICVTSGAIVLALSSLTSDHRYVTVGWLAVCLLPIFAQGILDESLPAGSTLGWLGCISLRDNVMTVTDWLFGMRGLWEASTLPTEAFAESMLKPVRPICAITVLSGWVVCAMLVTYWRVVTFSRSAANV